MTVNYTFRVPNKNCPKDCLCSPPSCLSLMFIFTIVIMFKCSTEAPCFHSPLLPPLGNY